MRTCSHTGIDISFLELSYRAVQMSVERELAATQATLSFAQENVTRLTVAKRSAGSDLEGSII